MKGSLSKIQSNYKHINNYGVINDLNPEIDEYKHIYNNLLDKSVNIENLVYNKDFNTDITKNILLWKLREYNLSIEYFTFLEFRILGDIKVFSIFKELQL